MGQAQEVKGGAGAIVLVLLVVLLLVLAGGTAYEQVGRVFDRDRMPRIGRAVDIGGRSLNIDCSGTGSPTVILEPSVPFPGYSWLLVERRIAQLTRVCWYDRAGFGWSDPAPAPRDSAAIARDLAALLQRAGERAPYVLVGSGSGGFHVRVFAGRHGAEVAGMVLVDSDSEDELTRMPWIKGGVPDLLKPANTAFAQFAGEIGVTRLVEGFTAARDDRIHERGRPEGLTDSEWNTLFALLHQSRRVPSLMKENLAFEQSAEEAHQAGSLGDKPLVVLTAGHPAEIPERERVRIELQQELAKLSTRGKLVLVESGRFSRLPYTAPDAIAAAVKEVVQQARRGR